MANLRKTNWLISTLCKEELQEEIIGNLEEYRFELEQHNRPFKRLRYWKEVINYLRPSFLKSATQNTRSMFIFNPQLTFRNLLKYKSNSIINLTGFILGLTSVIFLYFYIQNEINYDQFHQDKDHIYRVIRQSEINGNSYNIGVTSGPFGPALKSDFPTLVDHTVRVHFNEGLVTYEDKSFMETEMAFVDQNFFEFFSFPLSVGDPKSVLDQVNAVVVSKEIAKKYFGDENPIGQIIEIDQSDKFEVTGILDDFPRKSHLQFNMVFSLKAYGSDSWLNRWWSNGLFTYVKISEPWKAAELNEFLPQFMDKYFAEDFKRNGNRIDLALEPFTAIYFNSDTRYDEVAHGNRTNIRILTLVAFAILFIACFNYLNLTIAQSHQRAKEVGVRKVLGVSKSRLIFQFLGESVLIILLAIAASIGLSIALRPVFNSFFDLNVLFDWFNPTVYYFILILIIGITLTAGVYPALLLSSFNPLSVMKGKRLPVGGNLILRKGLVVIQFVISTFLILSTIFIMVQLNYINNKDLGFDQEAILIVESYNQEIRENDELFIDRIKSLPSVKSVTATSGEPGGFHDGSAIRLNGQSETIKARTVFSDPYYLETFGIPVVAGRGFDDSLSTERETSMMISEKLLADMGMTADEVIGQKAELMGWDLTRTIVGVFKDFHFLSLRDEIEPLVILMAPYHRRIAIKLHSQNLQESITAINEVYDDYAPNYPMNHYFHDASLARQYENEKKQANIFLLFAGVSILLASMGIFGLVSHATQQRQKELGIRKVLGAKVAQIIAIVSKEFIILVSIAALIAIPFSIYFIQNWLNNFAYHIEFSDYWLLFPLGGIITALITSITVGLKTYKSATSNPVESIRYE
ncbi:ABC transporter permease [Marinoscillum sp.]|uniref:ABC transporter permease n=1 Tax=Marinoscillum sp. TaxID=2024838 RepID=UPI003BAD4410